MTKQQILRKALNKAKDNGWKSTWLLPEGDTVYSVIFSHDFAKAFWGDDYVCSDCCQPLSTKACQGSSHSFSVRAWQIHLQKLVLEEEPLLYLKRFL